MKREKKPLPASQRRRALVGWIGVGLLVVYIGLFFIQKINLQTADLGRHLINGQVILAEGLRSQVLSSNFYSYTAPDFVFPNHHWLYGVIAHWWYQLGGFAGLVAINTVLAILAVGLVAATSISRAGKAATMLALLLALPLFTQRTEVRPETVSLLLMALSLWLLNRFITGRLRWQWLAIIQGILMVVWVNIHLFFVLNLAIIGIFFLAQLLTWLRQRSQQHQRYLIGLTVTLAIASVCVLVNPQGIVGALTPLRIFTDYAYPVAENQSVWFYLTRYPTQPHPWYFVFFSALSALGFSLSWRKRSLAVWIRDGGLLMIFLLASTQIVRLFPFLALAAIPIVAANLAPYIQHWWRKIISLPTWGYMILSPLVFVLIILVIFSGIFIPRLPSSGLGVYPRINDAAAFYQQLHLSGPIFNNYDIGSYLIFHLFDQERQHPVFIDNRPEHYPTEIIRDQFIAGQESEEVWQQLVEKYTFESIFFYRLDATNWAQPFLITRLQDPQWAPVFADDYSLLLLRRSPELNDLISQYELPPETFTVVKPK